MSLTNLAKFPAPYYGGKTHAIPLVWAALGDVQHYVAPFCGTCVDILLRPHPANRPAMARHAVCWVLRNELGLTLVEISRILDRDHSTISYAIAQAESHAIVNARYALQLSELLRR